MVRQGKCARLGLSSSWLFSTFLGAHPGAHGLTHSRWAPPSYPYLSLSLLMDPLTPPWEPYPHDLTEPQLPAFRYH